MAGEDPARDETMNSIDMTDLFDPPTITGEVPDLSGFFFEHQAKRPEGLRCSKCGGSGRPLYLWDEHEGPVRLEEADERLSDRAPKPKRTTATEFWDKPVLASEKHIDFRNIARASQHQQDKLTSLLTGPAQARLIRQIAQQTVQQAHAGRHPAEMTYGHDHQLEGKIAQIVRSVYQDARAQVKDELARQTKLKKEE